MTDTDRPDSAVKQAEALITELRTVDLLDPGWIEGELRAYSLQVRDTGDANAADAILSTTGDVSEKD